LEKRIMSQLDDIAARLNASAQANIAAGQAIVLALNDLKAQVAAGQDNTQTVNTLTHIADQIDASTATLQAAVAPPQDQTPPSDGSQLPSTPAPGTDGQQTA
jgi:hypothetical protein